MASSVSARVDVVDPELVGRAAQRQHDQPAAGQLVEHGDFLGHPQRVVDRDDRAEPGDPRPVDDLRQRPGPDRGVGRAHQRGEVVLGHGHEVEARLVRGAGLLQGAGQHALA
jgi:hypothetical protein